MVTKPKRGKHPKNYQQQLYYSIKKPIITQQATNYQQKLKKIWKYQRQKHAQISKSLISMPPEEMSFKSLVRFPQFFQMF